MELFLKFNPQVNRGLEQDAVFPISLFIACMDRWCLDPNILSVIYPLFETFEIISQTNETIVRKLYPKSNKPPINEYITFVKGNSAHFIFVFPSEKRSHSIGFKNNKIYIRGSDDSNYWRLLLHRCFKWCVHDVIGGYQPILKDQLFSKTDFQTLYKHLKKKYALELCRTWTECTDAQKYVYEDIALSAYLICLWKNQNVVFADLGCGNGLLTYLLHKEGYKGYGIDLRARKIWPRWTAEGADLKEDIISDSYLVPSHVNWAIGNHADQLVPLIPKMAKNCCLFLLPCCFYDKKGNLFAAPKSNFPVPPHLEKAKSRYKRYLQYIGDICLEEGFQVTFDVLRIPSTKNIALICFPKQ